MELPHQAPLRIDGAKHRVPIPCAHQLKGLEIGPPSSLVEGPERLQHRGLFRPAPAHESPRPHEERRHHPASLGQVGDGRRELGLLLLVEVGEACPGREERLEPDEPLLAGRARLEDPHRAWHTAPGLHPVLQARLADHAQLSLVEAAVVPEVVKRAVALVQEREHLRDLLRGLLRGAEAEPLRLR